MYTGKTVFSQLMDFLPMYEFRKCVDRYSGNHHTSRFSCMDQYLSMAFAQLTYRESLRDIEACLRSRKEKLYHLGIRGRISKSTLAEANEKRDWRIYADFCQIMISKARSVYSEEDFGVELKETAYALDSTTIDLCLSIFPWASFRKHKAAVKMHTLMDLRGNIPSFIEITEGSIHDVNILDVLVPEPGSFYIMDRGYLDFERLYILTHLLAFFITRAKKNTKFRRIYSQTVDRADGLRCDQTIMLVTPKSLAGYPEKLRRVKYFDAEREKQLVFLTNNFVLPALTIAKLYKCRWQIELFFKWIKQHLRIKAFYGTSINAVKTQIWIAVSTYVLVATIRKRLHLELNLYTILQILSVTLFEKVPLDQLFANYHYQNSAKVEEHLCNQLNLFDY
jgi:hypothetical protein